MKEQWRKEGSGSRLAHTWTYVIMVSQEQLRNQKMGKPTLRFVPLSPPPPLFFHTLSPSNIASCLPLGPNKEKDLDVMN